MIEVIDLEKHFGDNEVLKGINVTVDKGDIMVVIGPSGSGKSTFLRCLNCMEDPTGGQIIFNGVDIADPKVDINIHRRRMGMVFQHFNLFSNKTVIQNIMLAPVYVQCQELRKAKRKNAITGFTNIFRGKENKKQLIPVTTTKTEIKKKARENAMSLLGRIGLQDKADVYPSTLSGGQKQRVAIAGVMAMRPRCIILDEPTAMLDPNGRKEVLEAVRELNRKEKVTVILITHYMEEVIHADRVYVMDSGNVVMQGNPKEIFSQVDTLKAYGLDVPQVTLLAYELKKSGVDVPDGILTTEELVSALCQSN